MIPRKVALCANQSRLDLLPPRVFRGRLPSHFVEHYFHWYDHKQNVVLFRPRCDPWSSDSVQWRLVRQDSSWQLVNGNIVLLSMFGPTSIAMSKVFSPLDSRFYIHTTFNTSIRSISISLPRLHLDFFIDPHDDRIQSYQYRDMFVDPDQNIGVLVGLNSKMVLKPKKSSENRVVLVPVPRTYGLSSISFAEASDHCYVSVKIGRNDACGVYAYSLDTTLGRVLSDGDVQRKLYLVLLHALTSHCLPDLLTGQTGTESALQALQSASLRSFEYLTTSNVELLKYIASIAPIRAYYPSNLQVMQQVEWNSNLPVLSQHPHLRLYCKSVIDQAGEMGLFYPENVPNISDWEISNSLLDARDMIRSSTYRIWNSGGDLFTSTKDVDCDARDVPPMTKRGQRAYTAATLMLRDDANLHSKVLELKETLTRKYFGANIVQGYVTGGTNECVNLQFDAKWLADMATIVRAKWCNLHRTLSNGSYYHNEFDLAAWLSTMAFSETADMDVVQAFATFYHRGAASAIPAPTATHFDLAQGDQWQEAEVRYIIESCPTSFELSREARLTREPYETHNQHHARIKSLFYAQRDRAINSLVAALEQQWPCAEPVRPVPSDLDEYVNVPDAMLRIAAIFSDWYHNRGFTKYLDRVSLLMEQQDAVAVTLPQYYALTPLVHPVLGAEKRFFGIAALFDKDPPIARSMASPAEPCLPVTTQHVQSLTPATRVQGLCTRLQSYAKAQCEKHYVEALRASCTSLEGRLQTALVKSSTWSNDHTQELLRSYLSACRYHFNNMTTMLTQQVTRNSSCSDETGVHVQHSPRLTPTFWLSQLHSDRFIDLSEAWKDTIVEYALAITSLHRAQRLLALSDKFADLIEEFSHTGHSNWKPKDFPEILLLEAESGILIRPEQEDIASHMRDPGAHNVVLQLLMGGGKSSTIVPMLAAHFSNKEQWVVFFLGDKNTS
jgi:hypothetical protein